MTITLTREEAQQVLEHLDDLVEAQQWEIDMHITQYGEEYKPHRVKHMRERLASTNGTIETLRTRLAQPEPEPVAWIPIEHKYPTTKPLDILMADGSILRNVFPQFDGDLWWEGSGTGEKFINPEYADITHWRIHSYTAPPQRKWQGLTAYEIQELHLANQNWGNFACAIEAKLKEKNT